MSLTCRLTGLSQRFPIATPRRRQIDGELRTDLPNHRDPDRRPTYSRSRELWRDDVAQEVLAEIGAGPTPLADALIVLAAAVPAWTLIGIFTAGRLLPARSG